MIDQFPKMFDITPVLTTAKHAAKRTTPASPLKPAADLATDLEFAAANQQLEGFPGKITETVASHTPNLAEIAEAAKRFGAQVPKDESLDHPPVFQTLKGLHHRP